MRILENLAGITELLIWAGALGMAAFVAGVVASLWARQDKAPDALRVYGRGDELAAILRSCLLAVVVASLWPPTAFVIGGGLVEITLVAQRRAKGAPAVELPAEGVAVLTLWRLLGWTAIGLVPSALPAFLVGDDGIAGLAGLVWIGLALGAWAAVRGAPTPFPLLAELAWVTLQTSEAEEEAPKPAPVARRRPDRDRIGAMAEEAAAPVAAEPSDDTSLLDAREAARRLASAAIAAQLAAMGLSERAEPTEEEPAEDEVTDPGVVASSGTAEGAAEAPTAPVAESAAPEPAVDEATSAEGPGVAAAPEPTAAAVALAEPVVGLAASSEASAVAAEASEAPPEAGLAPPAVSALPTAPAEPVAEAVVQVEPVAPVDPEDAPIREL